MKDEAIPHRSETLKVLRLMRDGEPILMLGASKDDFGTRWTLSGQEVLPAIATYLMDAGFLAAAGKTGMGATRLILTDTGVRFRDNGLRWWHELSWLQKLKIMLFG